MSDQTRGQRREFQEESKGNKAYWRLIRLLMHGPKIVFGMLEVILGGDPIATQRFSAR